MALIRAEVQAAILRAREVWLAAALALAGLWLIWLGGYFLIPVGVGVLGLAAVWARLAWRRMRFDQGIAAPGVVEVNEGQVGYLGPTFGGFVALPDLMEIRILRINGERLWRLKQADGQALLIPVRAAGADRLFDAFCSLPGMEAQALSLAVAAETQDARVVWRREGRTLIR